LAKNFRASEAVPRAPPEFRSGVREDLFAEARSSIVFTSGCAENRRSLEESNMTIRQQEHQLLAEILSEELEEAGRRITDRLSELERRPVASKDDSLDGVRRFYQDLTDNDWTEADEQALSGLTDSSEEQTKRMMREAFRRSRVHPIPSLASLINVARKGPGTSALDAGGVSYANPDAVPAAERERMANLLHRGLRAAASEIASRLDLTGPKADVVREQLEDVEGAIVSEFTPLV